MKFRTLLLLILAISIAVLVLRLATSPEAGAMRSVPERYLGDWVTAAEGFSDRYLEIRRDSIVFGTGGVTSQFYEVTGFDEEIDADGTTIGTIHFRSTDGGRFRRNLTVSTGGRATLVFTNQPDVVWIRN